MLHGENDMKWQIVQIIRVTYPLPVSEAGMFFPSRAVWAEMCQVVSRPPSFKNIRGSKMQTDKAREKIGTGWPIKLLVFILFIFCHDLEW